MVPLEEHSIQTLLCGITGHPAQARANYFISEMFTKVITLKKSLNQQLAANQRSLFFPETHISGRFFNKGGKQQHCKVSTQILLEEMCSIFHNDVWYVQQHENIMDQEPVFEKDFPVEEPKGNAPGLIWSGILLIMRVGTRAQFSKDIIYYSSEALMN